MPPFPLSLRPVALSLGHGATGVLTREGVRIGCVWSCVGCRTLLEVAETRSCVGVSERERVSGSGGERACIAKVWTSASVGRGDLEVSGPAVGFGGGRSWVVKF